MSNKTKTKPAKNGASEISPTTPEPPMTAITADYENLVTANPGLRLPLVNIIQQRLLAEKDVEIAELKAAIEE